MSPADDIFKMRCRDYLGIIKCTTIDWMCSWPQQALYAVANVLLKNDECISAEHRDKIVLHTVSVHVGVEVYTLDLFRKYRRNNYVTPKHFVDFINTFLELSTKKKKYVNFQCNRFSAGLKRITEFSENLVKLNDTLSVQSTEVIELTKECDALVTSIGKLEQIILQTKETNLRKKDELTEKHKITAKEPIESKEVFADVLLELDTTKKALNTLTNSDVAEFKSFPTPPQSVQIVGECLAIIKGSKEISWESFQNLVSDPNFLESLQDLDANEMTKQHQLIKTCLKKCDELDQLKSISRAGFVFYKFVLAVLHYSEVYQHEQEKSERIQKFKIESEYIRSLLRKEENELEELEKQLAELNVKYEATLIKKHELQEEIDVSQRNLSLADKIVNTLSSESDRWEKELKCLQDDYESIIGNCLLSSGFLIYCGPFPGEFRNKMVYNDWLKSITEKNIPLSKIFRLENQLSNDVEMREWNSQGLPQDEFSTQNGILTMYSTKFALCIDPHNQALNWLKKKEKKNLKIVSFYDKKYIKDLELALENGYPIIFQDVDYFDYILENVVEKNIQKVNGRSFVIVGDKKIEYNVNFRIYFMTKISNPNFDPAIYSKATVINFMLTMVGLENQLLSIVVQSEKKDVEEKKDKLIADTGENKDLIQKLEDTILQEISTSKDNLLDNINLLETMENFKSITNEAVNEIDQDNAAAADVNRLRNNYRPVATRGAILFFVLVDLATINPMYQYSFSSYLKVFIHSLRHAPFNSSFSERLENIIQTLTTNIFDYGCMGSFEKHKILLSFHIATKIELSSGKISQEELDFFIKRNVTVNNSSENPICWLPPSGLEDILTLSAEFTEFSDLYNELQVHSDDWYEWFQSDTPELIPCPGQYSKKLSAFQKLMLLKCFRVDRIRCGMINYISGCLGEKFITPRILSFNMIYEQSDSTIPVIFILSPGTEPTSELNKFAGLYGFRAGKFQNLFLGQGQEEKAVGLLETAMTRGQWLVLQNCHLSLEFVRRLEEKIDTFTKPHPDFRLWLTTELSKNFPIGILQRSLKVVSESPSGLKMNLKNTYIKMEDENLENCNHPNYKHLVYVLAFFHAIIQERKKYGRIGWTLDYDFSDSDLAFSISTLNTYLSKLSPTNNFPWNSVKYMIGEVIYGGKVIDSYDRRLFGVYMDEYFGDFLFDASHPFHFYKNNDTVYVIPSIGNKNDYIEFIENLSPGDSPQIFGLNSNAEIDYFVQSMTDMLTNLNDMQPQRSDSPSKSNREELVDNMATDLLTKIPPEYNMTKVRNNFGLAVTPLVIVLFQELEIFNKLIKKMNTTLTQLKKSIAGEINVDKTLESLLDSLYNGVVPKEWASLAPVTQKTLARWISHINKRTDQYTDWSGSNEPIVLWLSGLNNPKSYLAAFFQMTCRKNNWPLDKSCIYTQVSKFSRVDEVEERLHQGCYVHGLYLEGARWDVKQQCLKKSYPKVKFDELPVLSIITKESHHLTLEHTVKTPVYVTSDRQNAMGEGLVFEADLRTADHKSLWILQGLCLLLNVD
ncbi:dynein axonemal heavy chain 10-like [Microplitis mediator]|uniref:dynein axonemal heavy chain 10-like n=1 Tax=Microplitis mediator TaxID=375433 RepID=UPI00255602EA|nr:dynein axonemal heavy chain 10-like [Microplitis mediator]